MLSITIAKEAKMMIFRNSGLIQVQTFPEIVWGLFRGKHCNNERKCYSVDASWIFCSILITATNIKDDNAGEITPIKRFPGLFPDFSLIFGLLHHLKRRGGGSPSICNGFTATISRWGIWVQSWRWYQECWEKKEGRSGHVCDHNN